MKVQTTTNYTRFKPLRGNRSINAAHKARLMQSMRENYRFTVIIVNEKDEVIDGQHRLACAQELGLPVNFVRCNGYGLDDVQSLNINSKNWTLADYMAGYCQMGKTNYMVLRDFKAKYKFGYHECIYLLTGVTSSMTGHNIDKFKSGEFVVNDLKLAEDFADKIVALVEYYDGARRRSFIFAMARLLKNPQFSYERFVSKLSIQRSKLYHCSFIEQYIELIEKIYNHYTSDKVNLRFPEKPQ